MEQERRRHKRSHASFIVNCRVREPVDVILATGQREAGALMIDLSEGGVAITSPHAIPVGAIIHLSFTLINTHAKDDSRHTAIDAIGTVVSTLAGQREYRLGVCFTHLSDMSRVAIRNYVQAAVGGFRPHH